MPTCADGELCKALSKELHGNSGHACRAGCGGRLHGICGEVEDPEGKALNNEMADITTMKSVGTAGTRYRGDYYYSLYRAAPDIAMIWPLFHT